MLPYSLEIVKSFLEVPMSFLPRPGDDHDKLLVLYLLNSSGVELSELQLMRITSELSVLDYFSLKKALYFLSRNGRILEHENSDSLSYSITEEGRRTLEVLKEEIRPSAREKIEDYLRGKRSALAEESQFRAVLRQDAEGRYLVHLEIFTDGRSIFSLDVEANDRKDAQRMVQKWKDAAIPVYQSVLANLC